VNRGNFAGWPDGNAGAVLNEKGNFTAIPAGIRILAAASTTAQSISFASLTGSPPIFSGNASIVFLAVILFILCAILAGLYVGLIVPEMHITFLCPYFKKFYLVSLLWKNTEAIMF
jgi:hypothetical protein